MASYPTDPGCIFCKIVAGQIPCHKLYEDDSVLAFLDVGPLATGHALIIPKGHWVTLDQVPDDVAAACMRIAPRLSRAIVAQTGVTAWNILQNNGEAAGQAVGHVHFHLIPRAPDDGLGYRWNPKSIDHAAAKVLASAIRQQIG